MSDTFVTTRRLAEGICVAGGLSRVPPVAPAGLMRALAAVMEPLARAFHFTPLVSKGQLSLALWSVDVDYGKAVRELGFVPTPVTKGIRKTVEFLQAEHLVPREAQNSHERRGL